MEQFSNWDARIGRRVRLRDLHILLTVVEHGSMVKAAAQLGVSQPAISDAIATLEAAFDVRLLDRSRKGVVPTAYGALLLKYGQMAIDDLRQGVREIEFLADPTAGELRIACTDTIVNGCLVPIIQRLGERYPRVRLHVAQMGTPLYEFTDLERGKVDLIVLRYGLTPGGRIPPSVKVEELINDRYCVVVSRRNPLARRTKIRLADLVNERWLMPPADIPLGGVHVSALIQNAFIEAGLQPPEFGITTFSVFLRTTLVSSGPYVSVLPASVLRLHADKLCELPVALPTLEWPVAIVTLKNLSLNPAVGSFIDCAREVTHSIVRQPRANKSRNANQTSRKKAV
jgi:DNA-binding transcriptional LysR family regulator